MKTIRRKACIVLPASAAALLAAGCEVTNPGPVQDEFLRDPQSQQPLVSGAGFRLAIAHKNLAYDGALPSREIFPTGQIGAHGHPVINQGGHWPDGSANQWNNLQQSRFIAETAIRLYGEDDQIPAERRTALLAEAHNWAGYAYRTFGEHYCYVVFDGGEVQPGRAAFEKAEAHFTSAIQHASTPAMADLRNAATAGRAQVRAWLGDWEGVVADAGQISDDFAFAVEMDGDPAGARNRIWFSSFNLPYRTLTAWGSWYRDYYEETGDPRTASAPLEGAEFSTGALSGFGQVPFLQQKKYGAGDHDMRLSGGADMRLLEAEALLVQGQWQAAMEKINAVRTRNVSLATGEPLEPWAASSLEEAWTFLKRERAIELWLEGRRWGDQRRWQDQGAPGSIDWPDFESRTPLFSENPRSRCFGVPNNERNQNPNVAQELPTDGLWGDPL